MNKNFDYEADGIREFVDYLLKNDYLKEDPEVGAVTTFLSSGYESLSDKQKNVFDKYVIERHATDRCEFCDDTMSWHEILDVIDEKKKICSGCKKKFAKD